MMAAARKILSVFEQEVVRMNLSRSFPVAVALSGGSDSMSLLWMAKQVFPKVVSLTVDHRLREGSTEESKRAAELAARIGVEHHILTVQWEEGIPKQYKIQSSARTKRYDAIMSFCTKHALPTLMTAHHLDDQIETMVYRMSKGSSIDGMVGMHALSRRLSYNQIVLARPLLNFRKEQLRSVCREAGLEWVEDKTNMSPHFARNFIRLRLREEPELVEGFLQLHRTLETVRDELSKKVNAAVKKLAFINTKYGYLEVDKKALLSLPRPILRRVLSALLKYVSANPKSVPYNPMKFLMTELPNLEKGEGRKSLQGHECFVFALDNGKLGISGAAVLMRELKPDPIKIGQRLHWDKRWEVYLYSPTGNANSNMQYYVRHLNNNDIALGRVGVRAIRRARLPPLQARRALPVVVDEQNRVVTIPHLKYVDKSYGLVAQVKYKPLISMDAVINQSEVIHYS